MPEIPGGNTPIDPDEAKGLRLAVRSQAALNLAEEENILRARFWATTSRLVRKDLLSEVTLRVIHRRMLGGVWRWAGTYRTSDKNIGVRWYYIPMRVVQLCENFKYRVDASNEDREVLSVDFHHQLVSIHPFPNGNGRHARFCADRLVENLGGGAFPWGRSDLRGSGAPRTAYLTALKAADGGDLEPLVAFARSGSPSGPAPAAGA